MRPAALLLDTLRQQRVRFTALDDDLKVAGPAEVLSPEIYQKVTFYKTELLAILANEPPPPPPPPPPEPTVVSASFVHGVRVELRRNGPSRWWMYVSFHGGPMIKRKDFATPELDHGQRTAALWYGDPTSMWEGFA